MKISVENLGTIKKGEISLDKDLTIFTGENNSGKSYMMYLNYGILELLFPVNNTLVDIYGKILELPEHSKKLPSGIKINLQIFLSFFFDRSFKSITSTTKDGINQAIFNHKVENLKFEINNEGKLYLNRSYEYFKKLEGADLTIFSKKYTITVDDEWITLLTNEYNLGDVAKSLSRLIFESISSVKTYFIPAERTAINMFYSDIINQKSSEAEDLIIINDMNEMKNKLEKLRKEGKMLPYAPLALMRYIQFAYDFRKYVHNPPTEFADLANELENLLGGGVGVSGFGDLQFQPTAQTNQIPLYLSSSLVKSWSGVVIYLRHLAQKNDILMIDEPEINLHPKSQILIARFLAKMVNRGIKIVLSTHSDYILRELSTLIIASNEFEGKEKLLKRYPEYQNQALATEKVAVYNFANHTIENVEITAQGIEIESINKVIQSQTEISDAFYYTYLNSLETETTE